MIIYFICGIAITFTHNCGLLNFPVAENGWTLAYKIFIRDQHLFLATVLQDNSARGWNLMALQGALWFLLNSLMKVCWMGEPGPWAVHRKNYKDPSIFPTENTAAYKGFDSVYTLQLKGGDWSFHNTISKLIFQFHIQETIPILYQANKKWVV